MAVLQGPSPGAGGSGVYLHPIYPNGEAGEPLGVPAVDTVSVLQQDMYKELINKLAWAVGSTYRRAYSRVSAPARVRAIEMARAMIKEHGWPDRIRKI